MFMPLSVANTGTAPSLTGPVSWYSAPPVGEPSGLMRCAGGGNCETPPTAPPRIGTGSALGARAEALCADPPRAPRVRIVAAAIRYILFILILYLESTESTRHLSQAGSAFRVLTT